MNLPVRTRTAVTELILSKMPRRGKSPLWHARKKGSGPNYIIGAGNTADNAIKDFQKQERLAIAHGWVKG